MMSVVTKVILDTTEYNRLLSIEKLYRELKAEHLSEKNQSGTGNVKKCRCSLDTKEECTCTPPLSEIIAVNEKARAVDIPPRGILPSITDPNEQGFGSNQTTKESEGKNKEDFKPANFRVLANSKDKWYFLGHFEEK